jgi:hypothetical protein
MNKKEHLEYIKTSLILLGKKGSKRECRRIYKLANGMIGDIDRCLNFIFMIMTKKENEK